MTTIFIIGSTGKIGSRLVRRFSEHEQTTLAYYKGVKKRTLNDLPNVTPVLGDITSTSTQELSDTMKGVDLVIFTAGAGGAGIDITNAVDGEGLERAVRASVMAGVKRFILISAFPEAGRTRNTTSRFENYLAVKKQAEYFLSQTQLDWLIVSPGRLNDEPGTGLISAGFALPYAEITRDDVANFVYELSIHNALNRHIIELTQGESPIDQAISGLIQVV
jgi:uncharacterized protein YbjT (DUF2867 family)